MLVDYLSSTYTTKTPSNTGMGVDKLVCVALVQIALRCTGVAYWPVVAEAMGITQTPEMSAVLGKSFLRTMKQFKKATMPPASTNPIPKGRLRRKFNREKPRIVAHGCKFRVRFPGHVVI